VAPLVNHGDSILIDAATYTNDSQVLWNKNNLTIMGVGGMPQLVAGSIIATDPNNGKGIFVISGANTHIENIEFKNAKVMDNNGAGIRQEGTNLLVSKCKFDGNENGILAGAIDFCNITVEYCEFLNSGSAGDPGYAHNIYIGGIDTFICRYNYIHEAVFEGHELKSRARYNVILYNRIANENSNDSRTIDLPNGGVSILMGNVIEQGANSANSNILGFGLEGLYNSMTSELYLVNNTFINKKNNGSFIQVPATGVNKLLLKNNIFAGPKPSGLIVGVPIVLDSTANIVTNNIADLNFVNASNYDYHLQNNSIAKDAGINYTNTFYGITLKPTFMYKDVSDKEPRPIAGSMDIGAFETDYPNQIIEASTNSILEIFPNPCTNNLFIKNVAIGSPYRIVNIKGEICKHGVIKNNNISLLNLENGIYILQIQQNKSNQSLPFEVRH
jgi:hypothetical protein